MEQEESTTVREKQIPPVEIPASTEISASAADKSDGICPREEEYDPTRLRRIDDVRYSDEEYEPDGDNADHEGRHFFGNVNTNALYDVLLAPNIGAEIAFSKDYSAGFNTWITWIRNSQTDHWRQNYGAGIYGRYWFGENHDARDFMGWHTGLYLGAMSYDIWKNGKGYQSPNMSNTIRIGSELGYSMRLGDCWRMDFHGGMGLLHTKQKIYKSNYGGGYYMYKERNRNLIDFMQWGISFNYILK